MVRRRARRGARELGLARRQAGHAHLRRAGHLVRRHRPVRRHAAHARRQRARRDHAARRAQGRLQGRCSRATSSSTRRCCASTAGACACCSTPSRTSTPCRSSARLAKQILLLARSYGVAAGRRDPGRPAARAGRHRPAARRLAPARQPGAEGLRARRRGAHRADPAGRPLARPSCSRSPRAESGSARIAGDAPRRVQSADEPARSQHRHQAGRRAARASTSPRSSAISPTACPASPARSRSSSSRAASRIRPTSCSRPSAPT